MPALTASNSTCDEHETVCSSCTTTTGIQRSGSSPPSTSASCVVWHHTCQLSDVFVNVEIKNDSGDAGFDADRTIVDELITELRGYDDPARILLSSFDPMSMRRAGEVGPDFLRGQLVAAPVPLDFGLAFAAEFGMDAIHAQYAHMRDDTANPMAEIRNANLRAVVWDVNTPEEVSSIAEAGADVLITDDPTMARATLDHM